MATKTKLKKEISKELKEQKEKQRQINLKENAKLKEFIIYTQEGCKYSTQVKEEFEKEGIKFIEKVSNNNIDEWNKVVATTNNPIFPTIFINDNYLVPRRDFNNVQQLIGAIKYFGKPNMVNPSFEEKTAESLKNITAQIARFEQNLQSQLLPVIRTFSEIQEEVRQENTEEISPKNIDRVIKKGEDPTFDSKIAGCGGMGTEA